MQLLQIMRKRRGTRWNKRRKDTLKNPLSWLLTIAPKKKDRIGKNFCQIDALVNITAQNGETADDSVYWFCLLMDQNLNE